MAVTVRNTFRSSSIPPASLITNVEKQSIVAFIVQLYVNFLCFLMLSNSVTTVGYTHIEYGDVRSRLRSPLSVA
jgi:hypothetical protein